MSGPILATKLFIPPPRPKIVLRPRLIERLNEGLPSGRKMTLISAPVGYGKTTLVSEWVAGCERPVAWLSLDEGDSDPIRFLTYLVAALQTIVPNIGAGVLRVLHSPLPPPTESILTTLLNEITTIPDNFILVLDDYHILDSKPVDNALTFLLEHLPPQMHLVITTREDPNLPLARLRARGQLTELRAFDLRFTPSEAAEFLNPLMGLNLSAEDIAALENRTEGWIAGLQLAALSMRGREDVPGFIRAFAGDNRYIVDYLVEEVLQRQSEGVRTFLLQTSILDWLSGPLCDAVTDQQASNVLLEALERGNLFVSPLDEKRHWFRYHHLFADVLHARLMEEQPDQVPTLHRRASEWYEHNGDEAGAFRHAIAARDFSRAAGLAETSWQGMNESFQSAAWLGWVKQLPEELIRTRPVLCTQIAWGFMDASEVDASESRLRDAERCLEGPSDGMVIVDQEQYRILPARIAFARAYNAQNQRDFLSTVKYAELVFKLTTEENHFLRAQATAILGGTYWANGDLDTACRSMSDWIDISQKDGNFIFAIAGSSGKADILTAQGHLREALKTYQQALQLASAHEKEAQRIIAHHHLGLAMLYHEMVDDEAFAQYLQKSLASGDQSTMMDWPYRRCLAQARLKEFDGDLDAALGLLDEAKRFYVRSLIPYTRPMDALKARIYLKQGRLATAEDWAREKGLSIEDELSYLHEFEHITLTRVLLAEYQSDRAERFILEALSLLGRLLKAAEDQKRMGSMLEILVVQTLAYRAQGDTPRAFASLERVLTLTEPEGYVRTFVYEGEPMRSLIMDFRLWIGKQSRAQDPKMIGYVDRLIAAFAPPAAMPQSKISNPKSTMIEPLSQRELEVLQLIAQGFSNREISKRLFLALDTVKGHNRIIFSKLRVQSRTEAVARARELGLL
jgi:LuxR family maltose regulon positive regulatory protein